MIDYYTEQIAEALNRIQADLNALHKRQNDWDKDAGGLYLFRGWMDPFIVKKHVVAIVREAWHLGDGCRELINAKWKAGLLNTNHDVNKGVGPGKAIVRECIAACRWVQLCGDVANLTKHYRLTQATKTGNGPPQIGTSFLTGQVTGALELSRDARGTKELRLERPVSIRPTLAILDEHGTQIGDAVEVAVRARDSWLHLLRQCGCTFTSDAGTAPPDKGA